MRRSLCLLAIIFLLLKPAQADKLDYHTVNLNYPVHTLAFNILDLKHPVEELQTKVESLKVNETKLEIKVELSGDILFDFDKADLRPAAEPMLKQVSEIIGKYKNPKVVILGFTDSKGDDSYNLKLSKRRADSVKIWLAKNGTATRFMSDGKGEKDPVAPNAMPDGSDNPDGRQKNRRVEITVKKS